MILKLWRYNQVFQSQNTNDNQFYFQFILWRFEVTALLRDEHFSGVLTPGDGWKTEAGAFVTFVPNERITLDLEPPLDGGHPYPHSNLSLLALVPSVHHPVAQKCGQGERDLPSPTIISSPTMWTFAFFFFGSPIVILNWRMVSVAIYCMQSWKAQKQIEMVSRVKSEWRRGSYKTFSIPPNSTDFQGEFGPSAQRRFSMVSRFHRHDWPSM